MKKILLLITIFLTQINFGQEITKINSINQTISDASSISGTGFSVVTLSGIPKGSTITNVRYSIRVRHDKKGDLSARIAGSLDGETSPSEKILSHNSNNNESGSFIIDGNTSIFNGKDIDINIYVRFWDNFSSNTGYIDNFAVRVTFITPPRPSITSISPSLNSPIKLGQTTTFTIQGTNLNNDMVWFIPDFDTGTGSATGFVNNSTSTTRKTFRGTPKDNVGIKDGYIKAKAGDNDRLKNFKVEVFFPTPINLTASAQSSNQINLSWANVSNTNHYKLYRSTSASGTSSQKVYKVTGTSFIDRNLSSNTNYYYRIQACQAGNQNSCSSQSNAVSASTSSSANKPPNAPIFQNVASAIFQNQQTSITIKSGTDQDNDNTRIKLYATGTSYTQSNPYTTNFRASGSQFTIPLTFITAGNKMISAFTEDAKGGVSNTVYRNVNIQTQSSGNSSPASASFISIPQKATINEPVNIIVKKGNDTDGDKTKLIVYADNSNYTENNPFATALNNNNANITVPITFNSLGSNNVYIKTADENNAESNRSTRTISVETGTSPNTNVVVGGITFTATNITESNNTIFRLSGNVKANNVLEFTGDVIVNKSDLSIEGNGKIFLTNIPNIGEVSLYNGAFKYNLPNNTSEFIAIGLNKVNSQFEMANLPVHINKIKIVNDGINIEGILEFPKLFNYIETEITELQITKSRGVQLIGDFNVQEIKLTGFSLTDMNFSFNTIEDEFNASGGIKTQLFEANATVKIIKTGVDHIGMELSVNNPYPLGATGLSISGIEGSVTNIQSHPNPPMVVTVGCSLTAVGTSPDILEFSNVTISYEFGTSLSGNGTFKIMGQESANAGFKVSEGLFKINATVNFYNVVNAAIEAGIAKNNNDSVDVFARFMASINIPNGDGFPFDWINAIPGIDLPYTVAEFDNILYNNELTGKGEIGWFNVNFSYKLSYDGSLQKEFAKNFSLFNEITFPGGTSSKTTALKFQIPSSKYTSKKSKSYNRFEERSLIISPSNYKNSRKSNSIVQDFVITNSEIETIIVRIKPESIGETPSFTLTTPNGEEISQDNTSNFSNVEYTENIDDKIGYFTINTPEAGSWDINLVDNGNTYLADIIGTKNKPGIVINNIEKTNNNLKIDWTDYNPDFNGQISLYYDFDNNGIDGTLIASGISEDDETDSYSFDISNLQAGKYYIYAIMFDEDGTPVSSYSIDSFTVSSNISAPVDFTFIKNPDNSVTFNWTKIDNSNNYDYLLYQEEDATVNYGSQNINTGNTNTFTLSNFAQEPIHQFMIVGKSASGTLSEKSTILELDLAQTQTLNLSAGWNLIGFGVESFDTNTSKIATLLGDNLLQIKTETQSYNPALPDFLNTLKSTENGQGYWLNVSNATNIVVRGKKIDLTTNSISLNKGWNLISYPSLDKITVETGLQSIADYLIQIKNINKSYNPALPEFLNTLKDLKSGEGYWINVNQNCTLNF